MSPDRRQFCKSLSIAGVWAVTGCITSGSDGSDTDTVGSGDKPTATSRDGQVIYDPTPDVDFKFDFDPDVTGTDDFGSGECGSCDGVVTITHAGGEAIAAESLYVSGASSHSTASFTEGGFARSADIKAGHSVQIWADGNDRIRIVWEKEGGGVSATLESYTP